MKKNLKKYLKLPVDFSHTQIPYVVLRNFILTWYLTDRPRVLVYVRDLPMIQNTLVNFRRGSLYKLSYCVKLLV